MKHFSNRAYKFHTELELNDQQCQELTELVCVPQARMTAELSGRAKVTFGEVSGIGRVVVKGYHRGGLLRKMLPSAFLNLGESRAEQEYRMLRFVAENGVSVPDPVAAVTKGAVAYRAWLALREIPGHRTLVDISRESVDDLDELIANLAQMVRKLIQLQVCHVDLHPGNVLVDESGRVYIIDFDKAFFLHGTAEVLQRQYLRRWRRAVIKHSLPEALSELFCGGVLPNFRNESLGGSA